MGGFGLYCSGYHGLTTSTRYIATTARFHGMFPPCLPHNFVIIFYLCKVSFVKDFRTQVFTLTASIKTTKIYLVGAASGRPHSSAFVFAKNRCGYERSTAEQPTAAPTRYLPYCKKAAGHLPIGLCFLQWTLLDLCEPSGKLGRGRGYLSQHDHRMGGAIHREFLYLFQL